MEALLSSLAPAQNVVAAKSRAADDALGRVRGLDTLRFFLAMWVLFGHLGFLPLTFDKAARRLAQRLAPRVPVPPVA